jgi:hypothetical protein
MWPFHIRDGDAPLVTDRNRVLRAGPPAAQPLVGGRVGGKVPWLYLLKPDPVPKLAVRQ